MTDKITQYTSEIESIRITSKEELEQFRIRFLGTKGVIASLFDEFKIIPAEQKKETGRMLNILKRTAQDKFNSMDDLLNQPVEENDSIDLSLPAEPCRLGSRHPVSIIRNQIEDIFSRIGFTVAEGPEIETGWYNFSALNFPENHPAMDMQDTFYIENDQNNILKRLLFTPLPPEGGELKSPSGDLGVNSYLKSILLRTHTSNVQIRVMENNPPPIKVICPGRVYRNETITARAHSFFHQIEGLLVDEGCSFADLKQTLFHFAKEMFGSETRVRFRPSYFPFTEPSGEMDISCFICKTKGCPVCKQSGWVEILGCGMVHPNVLENCKIDSNKFTGFAFGMGIERIAMLRYRINDIRILFENDLRFLKQFSGVI